MFSTVLWGRYHSLEVFNYWSEQHALHMRTTFKGIEVGVGRDGLENNNLIYYLWNFIGAYVMSTVILRQSVKMCHLVNIILHKYLSLQCYLLHLAISNYHFDYDGSNYVMMILTVFIKTNWSYPFINNNKNGLITIVIIYP